MTDPDHEASPSEVPNFAPFVEVCLTVIAVLVLGRAGQAARERKDVRLAQAVASRPVLQQKRLLRVQVTADNKYVIFGKERSEAEVKEILRERKDRFDVLVEPDKECRWDKLHTVLDFCEELSMKHSAATERKR